MGKGFTAVNHKRRRNQDDEKPANKPIESDETKIATSNRYEPLASTSEETATTPAVLSVRANSTPENAQPPQKAHKSQPQNAPTADNSTWPATSTAQRGRNC